MLEHLSPHGQPSIGISHKFIIVGDWSDDLEVQIREMIRFSGCDGLYLPLLFMLLRYAN